MGQGGRGAIKVINIQIEETCVEHHWSKDAILVFDVGGSVGCNTFICTSDQRTLKCSQVISITVYDCYMSAIILGLTCVYLGTMPC